MRNLKNKSSKGKKAEAIVASTNNISYVVKLLIIYIDQKRKPTIIVDEETPFNGVSAIECRKKAFNHAFQLIQDASIDGKLCKIHIDSLDEGFAKDMRNTTALWIDIDCLDNKTGDRMTISEADFFEPPDEYLGECIAELRWYREYGYDTEGKVIPIVDDGETVEILDFTVPDFSDLLSSLIPLNRKGLPSLLPL